MGISSRECVGPMASSTAAVPSHKDEDRSEKMMCDPPERG